MPALIAWLLGAPLLVVLIIALLLGSTSRSDLSAVSR